MYISNVGVEQYGSDTGTGQLWKKGDLDLLYESMFRVPDKSVGSGSKDVFIVKVSVFKAVIVFLVTWLGLLCLGFTYSGTAIMVPLLC